MNDRHKHLRAVEGGQSDGPNQTGPVPRATYLAELSAGRAFKKRALTAEKLAARRGEIILLILGTLPLATKEQIIGAGYADIVHMDEKQFGIHYARVQNALGGKGE
jgi:hypothetical protein